MDLEVVCAWPLSGQYGPGLRMIYYLLIAGCVIGRDQVWLRDAMMSGAVLYSAMTAIHAVTLSVFHQDGAIDMDIYGALFICLVGVVTAPVLISLCPKTYFDNKNRFILAFWLVLMLAASVSLYTEFRRSVSWSCHLDEALSVTEFLKLTNNPCGVPCFGGNGPTSPLRGSPADAKYVLPVPRLLPFQRGKQLAALLAVLTLELLALLGITWNETTGRLVKEAPKGAVTDKFKKAV